MNYTIYVVDDDESVAKSLKWLLESIGYEVFTFDNGQSFLEEYDKIDEDKISCLILDVRMPVMGGFELQKALNEKKSKLPIIFLSGHGDIPQAISAIKSGAKEFLQKPINDQELIDKINSVILEYTCAKNILEYKQEREERINKLSNREREILKLVSDGSSSKEIARILKISYKTVEAHRYNLRKKLNVSSIAELTRIYFDKI